MSTIGNNLKRIREYKNISQRELARMSDTSYTYINRIERDVYKNPSLDVLSKIAKALNVKIEDLTNSSSTSDNSKPLSDILNEIYDSTPNSNLPLAALVIKKLLDENLLNDDGSMPPKTKRIVEEAVKLEAQIKKLNQEKGDK